MVEAKTTLIPEIIIKAMAKEIKDGDKALHGLASPLPILAMSLAKLTHAPNSVFLCVAEGLDPDLDKLKLTISSGDPRLSVGAIAFLELADIFDLCQRKELNVMFLGGAQIDKYGNTNLSVIGEYDKPKIRLPGGAATAYMTAIMPKLVIWAARQNKRVFVEKVDFRTGVGYLEGGSSREKSGAWPTILKIVTNLAVYGFDERTKMMKVESIHPGVTADMIRENTGFDIEIPPDVTITEMPGEEELHIIRKLDPDNIRYSEFR
jgi:glutaconate CoA-transferase subunit B